MRHKNVNAIQTLQFPHADEVRGGQAMPVGKGSKVESKGQPEIDTSNTIPRYEETGNFPSSLTRDEVRRVQAVPVGKGLGDNSTRLLDKDASKLVRRYEGTGNVARQFMPDDVTDVPDAGQMYKRELKSASISILKYGGNSELFNYI